MCGLGSSGISVTYIRGIHRFRFLGLEVVARLTLLSESIRGILVVVDPS